MTYKSLEYMSGMMLEYLERWSVGAKPCSARKMHNSRDNTTAMLAMHKFLQLINCRLHGVIFNIISYIK